MLLHEQKGPKWKLVTWRCRSCRGIRKHSSKIFLCCQVSVTWFPAFWGSFTDKSLSAEICWENHYLLLNMDILVIFSLKTFTRRPNIVTGGSWKGALAPQLYNWKAQSFCSCSWNEQNWPLFNFFICQINF